MVHHGMLKASHFVLLIIIFACVKDWHDQLMNLWSLIAPAPTRSPHFASLVFTHAFSIPNVRVGSGNIALSIPVGNFNATRIADVIAQNSGISINTTQPSPITLSLASTPNSAFGTASQTFLINLLALVAAQNASAGVRSSTRQRHAVSTDAPSNFTVSVASGGANSVSDRSTIVAGFTPTIGLSGLGNIVDHDSHPTTVVMTVFCGISVLRFTNATAAAHAIQGNGICYSSAIVLSFMPSVVLSGDPPGISPFITQTSAHRALRTVEAFVSLGGPHSIGVAFGTVTLSVTAMFSVLIEKAIVSTLPPEYLVVSAVDATSAFTPTSGCTSCFLCVKCFDVPVLISIISLVLVSLNWKKMFLYLMFMLCRALCAKPRLHRRSLKCNSMRAWVVCGVFSLIASESNAQGPWTTARLSVARQHLAAASVGNLAVFAGGHTGGALSLRDETLGTVMRVFMVDVIDLDVRHYGL